MKRESKSTLSMSLEDLAVKGYKPINGEWDMVTIVGEIPEHKILLTFHNHYLNINLSSTLTEWNTLDFSITKEFIMQGHCRAVHIIYSTDPRLVVAKRNQVEIFQYIQSVKLVSLKRISLEHFFDEAAYFEVQKLSLEKFGMYGITAYGKGLQKGKHRQCEINLYGLKGNKHLKRIVIEQKSLWSHH